MRLLKKQQVYSSVRETKAWNLTKREHIVRIVTFVYERKFWKFHFFRVVQFIPLLQNPYYDGEYSSNESVKADAVEEKAKAYNWIYTRKQKRVIK